MSAIIGTWTGIPFPAHKRKAAQRKALKRRKLKGQPQVKPDWKARLGQ